MLATPLHHFVVRYPVHAAPAVIGEPVSHDAMPSRPCLQQSKLCQAIKCHSSEAGRQLAWYLERAMI